MAEVVAEMQAADGNSIVGVNPAVAFADPNAVFPAGSLLNYRRGVNLSQPYSINLVDPNEKTGFTNLEAIEAETSEGRPRATMSARRSGHIAVMPPTMIPTEPKLVKPQSA